MKDGVGSRVKVGLCVLASTCTASTSCAPSAPGVPAAAVVAATHSRVVDVGPLRIDGIYHSMEGVHQRVALDTAGIGWITGFRTEVLDAATDAPLGDEYFCHSQIQLDTGARLMVAATGIPELRLPAGFGIPLAQILGDLDEPWRGVSMLGMVLNNYEEELDREVKLRFVVDYVGAGAASAEAAASVESLYRASVTVLPDDTVEVLEGDGDSLWPSSLPETAKGKVGHWMVPSGRQIVRQRHRGFLPGVTQVHYGVVHMHNHGTSMKLTDVTDGTVLWETSVKRDADRPQILEIPVYSSADGFTMYPDHEYEIESVYDNTSDEPVDAMAVMYLYHRPAGDRQLTYPPPPGAVPPGQAQPSEPSTEGMGEGHHH